MDSINSVGPVSAIGALTQQNRRNPAGTEVGTPAAAGKNTPPATLAEIKAAVDAANQALEQSNQGFSFEFDDTSDGMSVKIIDKRSNTVVKMVPSLQILGAARALADLPARGALLKSKA